MLIAVALLALAPLAAADDWTAFRSGPFEVLTNAGDDPARDALNTFDQLRFTLGLMLGKPEPGTMWPVRIVVYKPDRRQTKPPDGLRLVRDRYIAALSRGTQVTPRMLRDAVRLLLEANTQRMPASVERGLEELFSTMKANGNRVTLGTAPDNPGKDFARMHMLNVLAGNRGRVRVLYSNLQQAGDWDLAYTNAFGRKAIEMEAEVDRYLAARQFIADEFGAKPVNPERDYRPRQVEPAIARLAMADLLEADAAQREYASILNDFPGTPDALEARGLFTEATTAGSRSATAWAGLAAGLKEKAKSWDAWQRAAQINPRWGEPHFHLAALTGDPTKKMELLRKAGTIEPRQSRYWQALAEVAQEVKAFAEAAQAWRSAERAASTDEERERMVRAQAVYQERRAELEAEERRREAEEKAREIARLKDEGFAAVRAAEARANAQMKPLDPSVKPVEWWEG
ncbi:MAG: hypothetical protein ACRD44_00955, partial [Bryobacteraceae bacterium]